VDDPELVDEQIRYYRKRATEYDATAHPPGSPYDADIERVRQAVRDFAPRGRVLELAAGTGLWTGLLAEYATELTAVDAAPEMLAINAARHGAPNVRFVESDVFALRPEPEWDVVFFGFWLSHVPPPRFDPFWSLVGGLLSPGGRVFLVDEAAHDIWEEDWIDRDAGVVRRELADGDTFRAVKVLWRPADLEARLAGLGWSAQLSAGGPFYWGSAVPAQPGPSSRSTS
jgi:demethylmenaquinone methyltransferase/2-methoxy-6-polyprenyl-1,4-benzoquinol methylase